VASVVNAHDPQSEVLHLVLEAENIGVVLDEVYDQLIPSLVGSLCIHVATETARIVAEAIGLRVRFHAFHRRLDRAQVEFSTVWLADGCFALDSMNILFERPRLDAASSVCRMEGHHAAHFDRNAPRSPSSNVFAVA
jgi:hypothetical protein